MNSIKRAQRGAGSVGVRRAGGLLALLLVAVAVAACGSSSSKGSSSASSSSSSGGGSGASTNATAAPAANKAPPGGFITNFVKYTHGKPQAANPSLPPVLIGYSSNDAGGTIVPEAPQTTEGAQIAVQWVNKYADGIDGHPLKLVNCPIVNSEEQGLGCAQEFLNNPKIKMIAFGALAVGATTIDDTVAGKKPIINGFSVNTPDLSTKNEYILFGGAPFSQYADGTFAKQYLHAKTAALVYPDEPGEIAGVDGIVVGNEAAGIKTKVVSFDPTTQDLTSAYTAAGAQTAGVVYPYLESPSNCLASAKALAELGVSPSKVIGETNCEQPAIKSQLPGGDYPKYNYAISEAGDPQVNDPTGAALTSALAKFGHASESTDVWYDEIFGAVLTYAQFFNEIGYSHLSGPAILAKVKAWRGPLVLGAPTIKCGKYNFAPASCADGEYFLRYIGNGKDERITNWVEPPTVLQAALEKLPSGASVPDTWPFPTK
jgi:branched-chain amino acid transport system substrate-binding protein